MTKVNTIHDVARCAGVSVATVSRVLNGHTSVSEKTRLAVENAIKTLNYQPNANAKALAMNNTDTIGVVVTDVADPFFAILVKAVDAVAEQCNKSILIGTGYHNAAKERQAIENLIRKRCNCLVVHSKALSDEVLQSFLERIPGMVIINRLIKGFENRCVDIDNQKGAFLATEMLIRLGHRRIGYLGSNHPITDKDERLNGYKSAMQHYKLPMPEYAIAESSPDFEGGERAMIELLTANNDLSAVVSYNDTMAAGALSVLYENNILVPQQFSVIGFDDMPVARYLTPKLTTIRYPIEIMATYATKLALSLVDEAYSQPKFVCFNPTLVVRASTLPYIG